MKRILKLLAVFLIIFNKFTFLHLGLQILCMFSCHHHILNEWRGFLAYEEWWKIFDFKVQFSEHVVYGLGLSYLQHGACSPLKWMKMGRREPENHPKTNYEF